MIKHSLFAVTLLLPLLFFVVCRAEPWTGRFTVEFEGKTGYPNQSLSTKPDQQRLPDNPSDIADTNDYAESDSLPDDKPSGTGGYRAKTTILKSFSWQWLHATPLLLGYEPILTTGDVSLRATSYSWFPLEMFVALGRFSESYWNPDSTSFSPIEQKEPNQDHPFATLIVTFSSGQDQQSGQPSESSGQQLPGAISHHTGNFISLLHFDSDDGSESPQQLLHTLGLNCFVHPCHGFCQLRLISDNRGPAEWPQNYTESLWPHLSDGEYFNSEGHFYPVNTIQPMSAGAHYSAPPAEPLNLHHFSKEGGLFFSLPHSEIQQQTYKPSQSGQSQAHLFREGSIAALSDHKSEYHTKQHICDMTVVGEDGRQRPCAEVCKNADALRGHKRKKHSGQQTCDVAEIGEDGQPRPCGKVYKNAGVLSAHKSIYHSGPKTCQVKVIGEDGRQRPCGMICINAKTLLEHKRRNHMVQQTCDLTVIDEDGQLRRCGMVWKNGQSLRYHIRKDHTGQQTCDTTMIGEDGQQQLCGMVCKNAQALIYHKRKLHTGQRTCDVVTVPGEDGQRQTCGMICSSAKALSDHKRKNHSGQRTCNVTVVGENGLHQSCGKVCKNVNALTGHIRKVHRGQQSCFAIMVGEDGQQRSCGRVFKNPQALSDHKRRYHTGQQNCDARVVGEDGQQRPCGKVCKNAKALTEHKIRHRKRKPVESQQEDGLGPQKSKAYK
ncbi:MULTISPECIES: hypothetical protein [unclassified Endozoicomonas]|uniref:hypothetical protein n=1 Tax=unclassified Endozoicomonas TaxID=2644528 RepID=UPI002147A013|nr:MULTISPECIES: hypothetical protein [unclassified Endozoicomonas]